MVKRGNGFVKLLVSLVFATQVRGAWCVVRIQSTHYASKFNSRARATA